MASRPNSNEDNLPTFFDFLLKGNFFTCNECDEIILERLLSKINRRAWHCYCLKCGKCGIPLHNDIICFCNKRRKIFCSPVCAGTIILCSGCELEIPQTELCRAINGKKYYHIKCFSCMKCCRQLNTDEKLFFINGKDILCEDDYEDTKENVDTPGNSGRPMVRKPCSKQARTRFNEYQKQILEESYTINSLPRNETQEMLSNKTGFSVSVIKTWFQNRRARDKRLKKTP